MAGREKFGSKWDFKFTFTMLLSLLCYLGEFPFLILTLAGSWFFPPVYLCAFTKFSKGSQSQLTHASNKIFFSCSSSIPVVLRESLVPKMHCYCKCNEILFFKFWIRLLIEFISSKKSEKPVFYKYYRITPVYFNITFF